jgi:hypothetical protein
VLPGCTAATSTTITISTIPPTRTDLRAGEARGARTFASPERSYGRYRLVAATATAAVYDGEDHDDH